MKLHGFKLLDGGKEGIIINADEAIKVSDHAIIDEVQRTRRIPLEKQQLEEIEKLKYFYLNLTGHWYAPFNKYFNSQEYKIIPLNEGDDMPKAMQTIKSLFNNTKITQVKIKKGGFVISGQIETIEDKVVSITTPYITEEDNFAFFTEALNQIYACVDSILSYFKNYTDKVLADPGAYAERRKIDIAGKTDEEILKLVYEDMEERGIFIMQADHADQPPAIAQGDTKVYQNQKKIDEDNVSEAEEVKEENEEEKQEEKDDEMPQAPQPVGQMKDPIGKGTLASEANFPDMDGDRPVMSEGKPNARAEDLSELEHSENLGIHESSSGEETEGNDEEIPVKEDW